VSSSTTATQTKAKQISIEINDDHYKVTESEMTGSQLKELASIAPANGLFLEAHGHDDDIPIRDDEVVQLKSGMKFYDVPAGNLG
jgi:Multiubiquitin